MFTGQSPKPYHDHYLFIFIYIWSTHDYNDKIFWPAVIGTGKALDVGEIVLLLISSRLPWGFEFFAYTDTWCLQVHII